MLSTFICNFWNLRSCTISASTSNPNIKVNPNIKILNVKYTPKTFVIVATYDLARFLLMQVIPYNLNYSPLRLLNTTSNSIYSSMPPYIQPFFNLSAIIF